MYIVYALKSINKNYIYVWMTNNLERRIHEHNTWQSKTTKPYSPFILIYQERYWTRWEARLKEKHWKSGTWKEKLKLL